VGADHQISPERAGDERQRSWDLRQWCWIKAEGTVLAHLAEKLQRLFLQVDVEGGATGVRVELPTTRWLPRWTVESGFASPVTGKGNQCVRMMCHTAQLLGEEGWDEPLTGDDESTTSLMTALLMPKWGKLKIW
jgi:hypothetical protein